MGNLKQFKSTKAQFRNLLRPVVMNASGSLVELEVYKSTTSKTWYRAITVPPTPVGQLSIIGNQIWELGVNIELEGFSDDFYWQTPLLTGVQADVSSGSTSTATMTISVIDSNEVVQGVCTTLVMSTIDSTNLVVATPITDPPTWTINSLMTVGCSGSYQGSASGFVIEWVKSGEVHTTWPGAVPPPVMNHAASQNMGGVKV